MKNLIKATLCASTLLSAIPAKADTGWIGILVFEEVQGACGPTHVGSRYVSVFRPRDFGENGPDGALAMFTFTGGLGMTAADDDVASGARFRATRIGRGSPKVNFTGRFKGIKISPADFNESTDLLTIRGKIVNAWGEGCTGAFRGAYVRILP